MELKYILLIWLLIIIIVFIIARLHHIRIFAAFTLALFIGLIVLILVHPMSLVSLIIRRSDIYTKIYRCLIIFTISVLALYIIYGTITDTDDKCMQEEHQIIDSIIPEMKELFSL